MLHNVLHIRLLNLQMIDAQNLFVLVSGIVPFVFIQLKLLTLLMHTSQLHT
jgi:hypothetical protein